MEIKRINGEIIFKADVDNIKDAVEEAAMLGANLGGADLSSADLSVAYLRGANLRGANLRCANLCGANLSSANLSSATLRGANLSSATLRVATLFGADLSVANLSSADLRGANLRGANLSSANLSGADLCGAKNIPYIPLACPSNGEFTGWKKVEDKLIRLLIPADAKRSSATSSKCRCDKAKVLSITSIEEDVTYSELTNYNYAKLTYHVGEIVYPDSFDENRWNECSHGIHFFIDKESAINY